MALGDRMTTFEESEYVYVRKVCILNPPSCPRPLLCTGWIARPVSWISDA
jgi:hypothetical protein